MITAVKADNVNAYKVLFEEASDILSGFERIQTYDPEKIYYYKDANTKEFTEFIFTEIDDSGKLVEFANALIDYKVMYTPTEKGPVAGFTPELGITTLEEYFNWLPDLKQDAKGRPTKYTVLPLDEPHFIINANTRAINIPVEFKKNGIAVQGDDLAEVVYFEIDRYFDAMDLNNCEIYILWETPKKINGQPFKSVSDVYIKDIESKPGKLIFGWAISDVLTEASGNLKFSVQFLQWDEINGKKTVAYSLNTLTASVLIHPSIGLNMEDDSYKIDNANDRLLERIQESEIVGGLQAASPYFLENLLPLEDGYDIEPNHTDGTLKIYAVATADDTGAISYVWKRRDLNASNQESDSEIEIPGSNITEMVAVVEKDLEGYPVLKTGHIYYVENNGAYNIYTGDYNIKDVFPSPEVFENDYFFEKKAVLEVEKYGTYTVEARNRIFNSISKARSKSVIFKRPEAIGIDNSKENSWGHIIGEESSTLQPTFNNSAVGDLSYQWYKAPETNITRETYEIGGLLEGAQVSYGEGLIRVAFADDTEWVDQTVGEGGDPNNYYFWYKTFAPEGAVYIREGEIGLNKPDNAGPNTFDDVIFSDEVPVPLADVANGTDTVGRKYRIRWLAAARKENGVWSYYAKNVTPERYIGWLYKIEWYDKDKNMIKTDKVKIQLSNEDSFNALADFQEILDATNVSYTPEEEGLYQVVITRTRNRASISEKSIEYRVTEKPEIPKFTDDVYEGIVLISIRDLVEGTKILSVEMTDDVKYDEYVIDWMLYRGDHSPIAEDLKIATVLTTDKISTFNPTDVKWQSIFEENNEDIEGSYYALVRTKRNGVYSEYTEKPAASNMFVVTGA